MDPLLVAAPLLVFAVVVLLGFTGCWLDTRGAGGSPVLPPAPNTYSDEVVNSGPIAFWKLTDPPGSVQAADQIPSPPGAHPGTYVGDHLLGQGPSLDLSDPDPNAAPARFSGGHVEVAHDPAFETPAFSVEVWVLPNIDDPPVFGTIVSNVSGEQGWALYCSPPGPNDTGVYGYWFPQVGDLTGAGGPLVEIDPAKLEPAVHLVMTYDGAVRLFRNGGLESQELPIGYAPNTSEPIQIGAGFRGAIQGVAVYDRALGPEEVIAHFMANQKPQDGSDGGT